jgi:hypothetical protein
MAHQLELSDEIYQKLSEAAQKRGITPEEFVAASVAYIGRTLRVDESQTGLEVFAPYIGAIDSSKERPDPRYRSEFGDLIDEKFTKQGLNAPKWER